ncbi:MAG: hypothetical protein K2W78_08680 [Xanthobacteraceae bacterium]|nr:hypothetical protein [Xanthobacteraceae bacterium]
MKRLIVTAACAVAAAGLAAPVQAKVVKFEIVRTESPAFEGRIFGSVGTYDRMFARATVAVSPADPHNTIVVDIDKAPRDGKGLVEATTDVEILRPTNVANGNRRLFYEVLNRGSKLGLALFDDTPKVINNPVKADDAGNGFLMRRGYTLVWSGWQGDVAPGEGRMTFSPPTVQGVTGPAREEYIFDHNDNPATANLSYPAADLDPSYVKLSVREAEGDSRATPADLSFKFIDERKISINRPAGFDAGAIYEFIYTAKDPKVMGLGLAATRDVVSFLRYEKTDATGDANPVAGNIDKAIGFGLSQSGRFLHDYLYLGFNADEAGRTVFDGLMPHISGGKKTFTNYRFSQPGRSPYEHADMLYPGSEFPFAYATTTDALTGKSDGILKRCQEQNNCPKILKSDSEIEFYQQRAGLVITGTDGKPVPIPDNVRIYFLSNLQHYALAHAASAMVKQCQYPSNPLNAGPSVRALLVDLDAWITDGTAPPPSRYPSVADGTLVSPDAKDVGFPAIPGFPYTERMARPTLIDFSVMPPVKTRPYPIFVPKTDADGRAIAGVHLPTLEAPIATHTGWNVRKAGFSPGELCDNNGSMIPFAATKAEREKSGDPRLSLEERYPKPGEREAAVQKAAGQLVRDRLLLEEDVKTFTEATQ